MNVERFKRLDALVKQAEANYQRKIGSHKLIMSQLRSEFNCSNLKEARNLLNDTLARAERARKMFRRELKVFEAKWEKFSSRV